MGRPLQFDPEQALERAQQVFWRHGYEGASLAELTRAMGITRPSLYLAFGDKEQLFRAVLDRYEKVHLGFAAQALRLPDTRRAVEQLLRGHADAQSTPRQPPGCLGVSAALACSGDSESVRQELQRRRRRGQTALRKRLDQGVLDGDLPPGCDTADLARYFATVAQGMAVQARSGIGRAALHSIVDAAMRAWPTLQTDPR